MEMHKTSDGVEIVAGLRVFTTDWEWGTVDAEQFERGGLLDPGGAHFDGWFGVTLDSGWSTIFNGERLMTRKP
ncbi:hypothetical protein [Streptomyces sp. NPDC092295]|uniref:hypothetical protein n=1 Tax=Streptomyces sp. NPDC092295 TaxID=3366011 RepID=UPI0037F3E1FE